MGSSIEMLACSHECPFSIPGNGEFTHLESDTHHSSHPHPTSAQTPAELLDLDACFELLQDTMRAKGGQGSDPSAESKQKSSGRGT